MFLLWSSRARAGLVLPTFSWWLSTSCASRVFSENTSKLWNASNYERIWADGSEEFTHSRLQWKPSSDDNKWVTGMREKFFRKWRSFRLSNKFRLLLISFKHVSYHADRYSDNLWFSWDYKFAFRLYFRLINFNSLSALGSEMLVALSVDDKFPSEEVSQGNFHICIINERTIPFRKFYLWLTTPPVARV